MIFLMTQEKSPITQGAMRPWAHEYDLHPHR